MSLNPAKTVNRFIHSSTSSSSFLFVAAIVAAIVANSPWGPAYNEFLNQEVALRIGSFNLFSHHGHPLTLLTFINDGLMAVFFFMVGLEIKRELLVGEISSVKKAALPLIAACGGMLLPVLVYSFVCSKGGGEGMNGLAIPMATDIAFSLGVLSLLGQRVPLGMKVFLTAFAVIDDIGGILVIALFYSTNLAVGYLLASLPLFLLLWIGNRRAVGNQSFYLFIGLVIWYLFLQSGVHSTIAGVLVAMFVPARPKLKIGHYIERIRRSINRFPVSSKDNNIILTNEQIASLKRLETASDHVISPLQAMEDGLHMFVNFFVLPLFAFANAGVVLGGEGELIGVVTLAVALGLIVGKFSGIFLFTFTAVKSRIVDLPTGVNWSGVAGIAMLGGIGFTVSLFIAHLSFDNYPELLNQAKLGVTLGTIVSGLLGYTYLHLVLPKRG